MKTGGGGSGGKGRKGGQTDKQTNASVEKENPKKDKHSQQEGSIPPTKRTV